MKRIFYEKVGRRYKPVYEYDQALMDALPKGAHLTVVYPGGQSTQFKIDPDYAAMIAAGRVAERAICDALTKASELRPSKQPLTERQLRAWRELADSFGDSLYTLHGVSTHDLVEAGVRAMITEADKLLSNATVRKAYERFQLVCELAKEQNND